MAKAIALLIGILLASHALLGFFIEGDKLLGVLNVDLAADILYAICAAALIIVGSTRTPTRGIRAVLGGVGLVFLAWGALGLADNTIGGILPTGLELMDFMLLFGLGGAAAIVAALPTSSRPLETGGEALN